MPQTQLKELLLTTQTRSSQQATSDNSCSPTSQLHSASGHAKSLVGGSQHHTSYQSCTCTAVCSTAYLVTANHLQHLKRKSALPLSWRLTMQGLITALTNPLGACDAWAGPSGAYCCTPLYHMDAYMYVQQPMDGTACECCIRFFQ